MPSDLIRDRTGAAPYVTPFLDALDRMQERTSVRPDLMTDRARSLLLDQFGSAAGRPDAAFAHGGTGLLCDHTHYFDGFALLKSLPLGTAVALRSTDGERSRIVFEGGSDTWTFDLSEGARDDPPVWVCIAVQTIREMAMPESQVEAAVVSTIPASCMDAYVAALGIATARACQSVFARSEDSAQVCRLVRGVLTDCMEGPFSIAYLLAADGGRPEDFSLVDTLNLERMPVESPSREILGWGLVDVKMGPLRDASFHRKRRDMADEAADLLKAKGFPSMQSLRDLEHKDLKPALELLPRRLRSVVRHLVTENRRVQKLVAAVRRRDWQMFGALLLMSHDSMQKDWESTNALVDLVVRETEEMSLEGMYGACMTGRGGSVLMVGQPFIIPRCLDRVHAALQEQFEIDADVMLL